MNYSIRIFDNNKFRYYKDIKGITFDYTIDEAKKLNVSLMYNNCIIGYIDVTNWNEVYNY